MNSATTERPTSWFTARARRIILMFLAGMTMIHVASWWIIAKRLPPGYQDFTIFYTAGTILSRGESARLYDNALQYQTQLDFAPYTSIRASARQGPLPYNHIPIEAALFVPFAKLPYFQAYALWNVLNLIVLAGGLLVLRRHLPSLHREPLWVGLLLALAFFPIYIDLLQGQDVLVLLLPFALLYSALRKNARFAAGCWLGLGLFRFTLVLPLALILAKRGGAKLVGGFTLAGFFMALGSAMVVGWKSTLMYPAYVLRMEWLWVGPATSPDMPNLRGLIETLSARTMPSVSTSVIVILSLLLLWFCWNRWKSAPDEASFDLNFSLSLIAIVLVSYHAYLHDLSILLIAVLLIINRARMRPGPRPDWKMWLPIAVFFLSPLCTLLLFKLELACLLAIPLVGWFWAVARESSANSEWP